jgi:hypothetical protein
MRHFLGLHSCATLGYVSARAQIEFNKGRYRSMRDKRFTLVHALAAAGISVAAALMTLLPVTALAQATPGVPPAEAAAMGAYKATHDTDPHLADTTSSALRSSRLQSSGALTAAVQTALPASLLLGKNQQAQANGYYCGPAAVKEAMGLLGNSNYSQSAEATALKTTSSSGTAWSGVNANVPARFLTGHPVRDVIEAEAYASFNYDAYYSVISVPYTPKASDTSNYIASLKIDMNTGFPMVGDAWEVAGYAHLTGHPKNQTIFHWFTIIGYENSGASTSYEDSATSIWTTVPAYTLNFSSSTLVLILGGRGYIW